MEDIQSVIVYRREHGEGYAYGINDHIPKNSQSYRIVEITTTYLDEILSLYSDGYHEAYAQEISFLLGDVGNCTS